MSEIVLVSGGVESSTMVHERRAHDIRALFLDYGQRAAGAERTAAAWQCRAAAVPFTALNLPSVGETFRAQRAEKWHVPLPHRNLVALSLALSFAAHVGAARVCIALNREDADAYPSGGGEFLASFQRMAATLGPIEIVAPYAALSKPEIIALGRRLGVDFDHTYSCLLGRDRPCGRCGQCHKREAAFAHAKDR